MAAKHELLCMDITLKRPKRFRMKRSKEIGWFKQREMTLKTEFKKGLLEEIQYIFDINIWWSQATEVMIKHSKEISGVSKGRLWKN